MVESSFRDGWDEDLTNGLQKSCSHALCLPPVRLGKGVPGKTSHNGTIGEPDSERYHQRPTRLPAEDWIPSPVV